MMESAERDHVREPIAHIIAFPERSQRNAEEQPTKSILPRNRPGKSAQELYSATLSSWMEDGRLIPMERTGIKTNQKDPEIAVDEALSMNDD